MVVVETSILAGVGAGCLRSVAGWLTKSLEDGKIDMIEWKMLGATIMKFTGMVFLLSMGLDYGDAVAASLIVDKLSGTPIIINGK